MIINGAQDMGKSFKTGDRITIYFGDTIRKLLKKSLRKKNTYFVDYIVMSIDGDTLTVFPNAIQKADELPCEISGLRISSTDRHILSDDELDKLRVSSKEDLIRFADKREFDHKEFKEALKPFRKNKKDK